MIESDNRFNGNFFQSVQQSVIISDSLLDQIHPRKKTYKILFLNKESEWSVTGLLWPTPKGRIRDQAIENLRDCLLRRSYESTTPVWGHSHGRHQLDIRSILMVTVASHLEAEILGTEISFTCPDEPSAMLPSSRVHTSQMLIPLPPSFQPPSIW